MLTSPIVWYRIIVVSTFVALVGLLTQASSGQQQAASPDSKKTEYQLYVEAVKRANDLAGHIHSMSDARAYLSEIVYLFPTGLDPGLTKADIQLRVARAEYEGVRDPENLISEQRVADVWNEYVRRIGGPKDAFASPTEIHYLRENRLAAAKSLWEQGRAIRWEIPNVYAIDEQGKVANACRPVEVFLVFHDLGEGPIMFFLRERMRKGIAPSEQVKLAPGEPPVRLYANMDAVGRARRIYIQDHGQRSYDQLLADLFDKLFPTT